MRRKYRKKRQRERKERAEISLEEAELKQAEKACQAPPKKTTNRKKVCCT